MDSLWEEFDIDSETQQEIRSILIANELVNLGADNWKMKLAAKGILLKPDQLDEFGKITDQQSSPLYVDDLHRNCNVCKKNI